jgi:hypothetical protein
MVVARLLGKAAEAATERRRVRDTGNPLLPPQFLNDRNEKARRYLAGLFNFSIKRYQDFPYIL